MNIEQTQAQDIASQIISYKGHLSQPLIDVFNIQYVVNILDRTKIESIDKIYRSKQDGFNLLQFIRFFLNVIEHEENETLYLSIALIDFFKEISKMSGYKQKLFFVDITNFICNRILQKRNDQNYLQSNYIIDYRTIKPNFKIKKYLIHPPKIYANKEQTVYKLSLNKIKIDKMKHQSVVTNCYFSGTLQKVFTLDVLSDSISIYNTSCNLLKKVRPNFMKLKKDIVILAFAYSQRQQRIGAVLKDFSINFWDHSDNFQFEKSISAATYCQQYQTNIWFFQYFNSWVTSDKTGYLYIWNLQTEKPQRVIKLEYNSKINDLCVIPCINLIAVVQQRKMDPLCLQKKENQQKDSPFIILYDYFRGQIATKIQLSPTSRVPHTLQYSETYHALLSAGYQKKISIYQINKVFLDTGYKGELTGHESLITCFTILKKSPMVVSADDKGKVKIWDIRNYKCIQTLDFRDKTNITRLLDMIQLGKIGVLGSRINFVDFDEKIQIQKKMMNFREKLAPQWIEFDYRNFKIIIITKKDLRVYDLKKGTLQRIYCQFHNQDAQITYFKYLQSLQKFVIANQKGQIKLYSAHTGLLQGKLLGHKGFVSFVQYDQMNKIFITMGQDSVVQIQKQIVIQSQQEKREAIEEQGYQIQQQKIYQDRNSHLLRQIKHNLPGKQLTIGAVSIYHGFIILGNSSPNIYLWDYEFSRLLAEISLSSSSGVEPTSMAFINGYSLLLIGTSDGSIICLKIIRKEQTVSIQLIWQYCISQYKQSVTNITVDSVLKGYDFQHQKLLKCKVYFATQSGYIFSIDMRSLAEKIDKQASATNKQSFNAQRHLRQNFMAEKQKKKHEQFCISEHKAKFNQNQFQIKKFQAHKSVLNGLNIIELDQRYLATIGIDQRLKIWKNEQLAGDININLPLPYKWQINVQNSQKTKEKVMFALKIIQKIFTNYGTDISINESKALRVKKLFKEIGCLRHITQPEFNEQKDENNIILFQNQFSKRDMHYDLVKQFNFNDVAGPSLKQIQVKKKLDSIQKEWQQNKQKTQQQKSKLLVSIRQKAQKDQQKCQVTQFLEEKIAYNQKSKVQYEKGCYIDGLMNKLQNYRNAKKKKGEPLIDYLKITSQAASLNKQKTPLLGRERYLKTSNSLLKQRPSRLGKKNIINQNNKTFERYFEEKLTFRQSSNKQNFRLTRLQTADQIKTGGFRSILHQMNERMQKSKKVIKKSHNLEDLRKYIISTSDGQRKI